MRRNQTLARTAASHLGLLTRDHLRAAGWTERRIDHALATGRLERIHRRVYAVPGAPDHHDRRLLGAVLAAGPGAALSHRSAGRLWLARVHATAPWAEVVELSVARPRSARLHGAQVHRPRRLGPNEVTRRPLVAGSVPVVVTTVERTVADLATVVAGALVAEVLEHLFAGRLTTPERLRAMLGRDPGSHRRGGAVIEGLLARRALGEALPDSALESGLGQLLTGAGIPRPVFQHEVVVGGVRRRLDAAYPAQRLAIEVDGFRYHRGRRAFDEDRRRQNDLEAAGWTVLRFTWTDIAERAGRVVALVAEVLARAEARPA